MNVLMRRIITFSCCLCLAPSALFAACAPSDFNGDGVVNGADLAAMLANWGMPGATDLDDSGDTNGADLASLLAMWGDAGSACGSFPDHWIDGTDCANDPVIQVHQFNDDTYILRQSLCTNFEAPFIYLLFGDSKVLMLDTGAGGIPIASTVNGIIDQWLLDNDQESIEFIVTHSHAHGDHVAGDGQFNGQPNTTVVGLSTSAVSSFFGITSWRTQIVEYDLGGRTLDIIPIPGHQSSHIAIHDRDTGLMLTGDSIYPGRLYISDFSQYLTSMQRLQTFVATNPIEWIVGTHVEMSSVPGQQFSIGSTQHPNEHPLELAPSILDELVAALEAMQNNPHIEVHDEFVIYPF